MVVTAAWWRKVYFDKQQGQGDGTTTGADGVNPALLNAKRLPRGGERTTSDVLSSGQVGSFASASMIPKVPINMPTVRNFQYAFTMTACLFCFEDARGVFNIDVDGHLPFSSGMKIPFIDSLYFRKTYFPGRGSVAR